MVNFIAESRAERFYREAEITIEDCALSIFLLFQKNGYTGSITLEHIKEFIRDDISQLMGEG